MNEKCLIWMALLVGIDGTWAHEGRMVDLKEAPLDQQVEAVEYCHGQYKVKLKDGARQVFMEFECALEPIQVRTARVRAPRC
jgi:hypothetical protein